MDFSLHFTTKISDNKIFKLSIATILLFSIYFLIISLNKGFNITDESYYILSITQPQNKLYELSHFGYELSFLYKLCGQNLIIFRGFGVFFLLLVSFFFALSLNNYFPKNKRPFSPLTIFVITFSSIFYYNWAWLMTPSYNWLNLISILLIQISLFSYFRTRENTKNDIFYLIFYSNLLGFSGALTFINKPPSAILLAFIVVLWVIYHKKQQSKVRFKLEFLIISASIACLYVLIHAFYYFGNLNNYITDITRSLHAASILGVNSNLETVFKKAAIPIIKTITHPYIIGVLVFFLVIFFIQKYAQYNSQKELSIKFNPKLIHIKFFVCFTILTLEIFSLYIKDLIPNYKYKILNIDSGSALFIFMIVFLFANLLIHLMSEDFKYNSTNVKSNHQNNHYYNLLLALNNQYLIVSIFLFITPFAYAIGTNNNILFQFSGGAIFIIASIFILISNLKFIQRKDFYSPFMIAILSLFIMLGSYHGYLNPYRLGGNIIEQRYPIQFLNTNYKLYVDKKTATYIQTLLSKAKLHNWKQNTPLIDLTGDSIGTLVALNANILGAAWFIGGLSGSNNYVDHILKNLPPLIIQKSWVLTAESGKISIHPKILKQLKFPENYEKITTAVNPYRNEKQILWKPK